MASGTRMHRSIAAIKRGVDQDLAAVGEVDARGCPWTGGEVDGEIGGADEQQHARRSAKRLGRGQRARASASSAAAEAPAAASPPRRRGPKWVAPADHLAQPETGAAVAR